MGGFSEKNVFFLSRSRFCRWFACVHIAGSHLFFTVKIILCFSALVFSLEGGGGLVCLLNLFFGPNFYCFLASGLVSLLLLGLLFIVKVALNKCRWGEAHAWVQDLYSFCLYSWPASGVKQNVFLVRLEFFPLSNGELFSSVRYPLFFVSLSVQYEIALFFI